MYGTSVNEVTNSEENQGWIRGEIRKIITRIILQIIDCFARSLDVTVVFASTYLDRVDTNNFFHTIY